MPKVGEKVNLPDNQIFPPPPPNHVFKERGFRKDPSTSVAQNYVTYLYDHVDYKKDEGIFTYYQGVELPRNGLPFAQAVYAINGTKRLIIQSVKLVNLLLKELNLRFIGLLFVSKKKRIKIIEEILNSFNQITHVSLYQYYMEYGYYTKTAKEVWKFTRAFLLSLGISYAAADKTGEIMALVFEYDDAYRFPLQDLMSETTKERLINDFPKEIKKLLEIEISRDMTDGSANVEARKYKFNQMVKLLRLLWLIPSIRKAIKAGLKEVTHENWQLDKSDIFHTYLWADYNICGKTLDERIKEYYVIYGNDESKMPPRVQIKIA